MKIIRSVAYRHFLLTAYVEIVGETKNKSRDSANVLHKRLSHALLDAEVMPPRYQGQGTDGEHIFLVPAVIAKCPTKAKSYIARLVLAGSM